MSQSNIRVANIAKAKIIYNRNRETYRIVIAFNVTETDKRGNLKFPTQSKCDFVSGDINYETLENDRARVLDTARAVLRTDNIEFV